MASNNPRVFELLEEMLNSSRTPEDVCADCPELLPEVRRRWQSFRLIDEEVAALLPDSETCRDPDGIRPLSNPGELPQVLGYRVDGVLGSGGMGVVYRAWDLRLDRPVALKMLLAGTQARLTELERFLREAQAVAALRHPNIVQVYDVGEVGSRPYFTMEFVEGATWPKRSRGLLNRRCRQRFWWRRWRTRSTLRINAAFFIAISNRPMSCSPRMARPK